jgi:hypothetical protein
MDTYTLVRTEHLNHNEKLFGGQLLKWVDEFAWLAAARDFCGSVLVTRAMDNSEFRHTVSERPPFSIPSTSMPTRPEVPTSSSFFPIALPSSPSTRTATRLPLPEIPIAAAGRNKESPFKNGRLFRVICPHGERRRYGTRGRAPIAFSASTRLARSARPYRNARRMDRGDSSPDFAAPPAGTFKVGRVVREPCPDGTRYHDSFSPDQGYDGQRCAESEGLKMILG